MDEQFAQEVASRAQGYDEQFKPSVTVEDVFKYLLRNKAQHRSQLLSDIQEGYLPATDLNSELISKQVMNDDNPDLGIDHIDAVLGDPFETDDLEQWQKDAVVEQFDDKTAAKIIRNMENKSHEQLPDDTETRSKVSQARDNEHAVIFDRLLTNLYKQKHLNDNDKLEAALRMVFNNATRSWAILPVDIRLDQGDINTALDLNGTFDKFNDVRAKKLGRELKDEERAENVLFNRQRVHANEVPMTYMSDKEFDENGKESSIFTPTRSTNTVYDIFASKLLKDLASGKAPDPDTLTAYIYKTYADRLKTMTWSEWQDVLDKEEDAINNAREEMLGRHLTEAEKVSFDIDDYDDLLTPEDWIEFMPENKYKVSGKTQEERKENRLHRQHGTGEQLQKYKDYLDFAAKSTDPDNPEAYLRSEKKRALKRSIKKHMLDELEDLAALDEYYTSVNDEEGLAEIEPKIKLRLQVYNNTDIGNKVLDDIANKLTMRRLRSEDFEVPFNEVAPIRSAKQQLIQEKMAEEKALRDMEELLKTATPAERAMYNTWYTELQNAKADRKARYKAAKNNSKSIADAELAKMKNRREPIPERDSHGFDTIESLEREMDKGIDE